MLGSVYEEAFQEVIGLEGGYVNNPNDRGGETKYGISKRQYPLLSIKNLTVGQARAIYKQDYWDKLRLDKVTSPGIAKELFDTGINMGVTKAIFILQESLNYLGHTLKIDGIIGPVTLGSVNKYKYPKDLLKVLNGVQFMYYYNIVKKNPNQKVFSRGWLKRVKL